MSKIYSSNGKYFLQEGEHSVLLVDMRTPSVNKSRVHSHQFTPQGDVEYPLRAIINAAAQSIFKNTSQSMGELVAYMRTITRLMRKPQVHNFLRIGSWTPFDEALAEILPQFNPDNKLWCLSETRPLGRMPSVNFMFAEGGEYLLPEDRFDTIFFPEGNPPLEVLLAIRTHGKLYFVTSPQNVEEPLRSLVKVFPLTSKFALFDLEMSPQLRQELKQFTPQSQLAAKKAAIVQVVEKLPGVLKKRNSRLDEYLAEVTRAEKLLAEIFPELHSDTVKFNFNLLKEFLIDLRLGNGSIARVSRQHEILTQDLSDS